MALIYQCNGLERANPLLHANQSLSITMVTDSPLINAPAALHMKSTPYGVNMSADMGNCTDATTFSFIFIHFNAL